VRVAGYARNSSDGQRRDETHEIQVAWLREQAAAKGWDLALYVDPGISGETIAARPELRRLLADVEAGRVDAVAVRAIDRLCRSQALTDWARIAETLKNARVRVISAVGDLDLREPSQSLIFTLLGPGISGFEKSMILSRTAAGHARALAAGRKPRGVDPLGLRHYRDGHRWEIVHTEAVTVRRAYELAGLGLSSRDVADRLRSEGKVGRSGLALSHGRVWAMLRARTYRGEWQHRGGIVRVPALIDPAAWERVQVLLGDLRRHARGVVYPLAGITVCAECGLPVHTATSGASRTPYLGCASLHPHYRAKGCRPCGLRWPRLQVEAQVWARVVALLSDPAVEKAARERARQRGRVDRAEEHRAAAEVARRRLADLEAKARTAALLWANGRLTEDAYSAAMGVLTGERRLAEERQRDAETALAGLQVAALAAAEHRATVDGLAGRLAAATPEERRRVLLALCPRRGTDGLRLRADGTWDLRGIRPAGAALSSPKGEAATAFALEGGPARCRGWRRRA
jgi:DNA invertase Pin-like site-specific DNA recombinase